MRFVQNNHLVVIFRLQVSLKSDPEKDTCRVGIHRWTGYVLECDRTRLEVWLLVASVHLILLVK